MSRTRPLFASPTADSGSPHVHQNCLSSRILWRYSVATQVVDLAGRAAAARWIAGIEAATGGAVDGLVNTAGGVAGQTAQPIEAIPDSDRDRIFAAFGLCRAAAPAMKEVRRGRIVNISSGAGLARSLTGIQAYCAAKHAVVGLTRQLAHELGPCCITVNSVAPGFVRTNEATEKQWASYGPGGRRRSSTALP